MTWAERFEARMEKDKHDVERLSSDNVNVLYAEIDRLRAWLEWMGKAEICRHAHTSIARALSGEAAPT